MVSEGASFDACPLCFSTTKFYWEDSRRQYFQCQHCQLISVPESFHLSFKDEKQEYDKHENSPNDLGYRTFLERLVVPLSAELKAGSRGLDFGCGPGPALSCMFAEQGMAMELFDPFYYPNQNVLLEQYDFVTATEVVEHLRAPALEFKKIWACVRPGAYLGLMTKLVRHKEAFKSWHYKNDPTHIQFYSLGTFRYLGDYWGAEFKQVADDAFIFKKPH